MVAVVLLSMLAPLLMERLGAESAPCGYKTRIDISSISLALENYKLDNTVYPSTEQGLQALLKKTATTPQPENWRTDGYLKNIPLDSWGRQFLYESDMSTFEIASFGEDGTLGGDDCDRDISNPP